MSCLAPQNGRVQEGYNNGEEKSDGNIFRLEMKE